MNNIEHFVHPGLFRDLDKAKATLELAKTRRSTGSGRFQGASVLWLVLCDGAPGGRGGAAYGARLRAERQRPVDLAVLLRTITLSADRSSKPGCGPSSRWLFRRRPHISNGPTTASSASCAATMPAPLRPCDRAHGAIHILPAWRAAALFHLGAAGHGAGRGPALPQRNTFVLGWIIRADRRGRGALGPAGASHQRTFAMGSPARRFAWRRASGRGYRPTVPVTRISGTEADRVVADAFGMHPEFFIFGDHRIDAVEQALVERRDRIGGAGLVEPFLGILDRRTSAAVAPRSCPCPVPRT